MEELLGRGSAELVARLHLLGLSAQPCNSASLSSSELSDEASSSSKESESSMN